MTENITFLQTTYAWTVKMHLKIREIIFEPNTRIRTNLLVHNEINGTSISSGERVSTAFFDSF